MPQSMEGTANTYDAQFFTADLEITQEISLGELIAVASAKDDGMFLQGQVPVEQLAELNAHWYKSVLIALSFDPKHQVFKVHILARKTEQLVHSQTGVQGGKGRNAHSGLVTSDGLPVYEFAYVIRGKRG